MKFYLQEIPVESEYLSLSIAAKETGHIRIISDLRRQISDVIHNCPLAFYLSIGPYPYQLGYIFYIKSFITFQDQKLLGI